MSSVLRNIWHSVVAKGAVVGIQFVVTTLLARQLNAHDYGIVGFANVVMDFINRLNSMGLSTALIRSPETTKAVTDTAGTLNRIFSWGAFLVAQLAAGPVANWFGHPEATWVIRVAAISFLFNPIGFLPNAMLNRQMRFKDLRQATVLSTLGRGTVSVSMAYGGLAFWSLVVGNLVGNLIRNLRLQSLYPERPAFRIDREEARKLTRVGTPLMLSGLVTAVLLNGDSLIIGGALGAVQLGFYTIALNWSTLVSSSLQEMVHSVLLPKFSSVQRDLSEMKGVYLKSLMLLSPLAGLANGLLLVNAPEFLTHVLGKGTDRWALAVAPLQVMCFFGVARAMTETVANPVIALGQTKRIFWANLLATVLELSLLPWILTQHGLTAGAVWVSLCYASQWVFFGPFLVRQLGLRPGELFKGILPTLIGLALAAAAALVVPLPAWHWLFLCTLKSLVFLAVFLAVHELGSGALLWRTALDLSSRFRR